MLYITLCTGHHVFYICTTNMHLSTFCWNYTSKEKYKFISKYKSQSFTARVLKQLKASLSVITFQVTRSGMYN